LGVCAILTGVVIALAKVASLLPKAANVSIRTAAPAMAIFPPSSDSFLRAQACCAIVWVWGLQALARFGRAWHPCHQSAFRDWLAVPPRPRNQPGKACSVAEGPATWLSPTPRERERKL